MIALLVQLEALAEPVSGELRWQRPHNVLPAIKALIGLLVSEISKVGELNWESRIGSDLIRRASLATVAPNSWIDAGAFSDMIGIRRLAHQPAEPGLDPAEEVLAQHRRHREATKREERLQWLLADA
jgi:hypothetical protein